MARAFLLFLAGIFIGNYLHAQPVLRVTGQITDDLGNPLPKVTVSIIGQSQSVLSDESGTYQIYSITKMFIVKYNLLGYKPVMFEVSRKTEGRLVHNVMMEGNINELEQVMITNKRNQLTNSSILNIDDVSGIPSVSGNFESMIKTLPGVSVNNELSALYSVRGGNFDENLVYINDIEISRPVLIRNAQQEGLSFVNSDLVSAAKFSAGGFEAKYGDKLSSVLDVNYGQPDSNEVSLNLGLLGGGLSTKILTKHGFFLTGLRYKNNSTILNSRDNKGTYLPNFTDAQMVYQYRFSENFGLNILGSFNGGRFRLVPDNRETKFGTLNTLLRLQTVYNGEELDDYQTGGIAVTANYFPMADLNLKWISSYFSTKERERIDIEGRYLLDELNPALGQSNELSKATGGYSSYAHNDLWSERFSTELKGEQDYSSHVFAAGFRFEMKHYQDNLTEYSIIDSAGYAISGDFKSFYQDNSIRTKNSLSVQYLSAYIQDSYKISAHSDLQLGLRTNYNTLSKQFLLSPRLLWAYRSPYDNKIFRFSAGVYHQPPDYRSTRDFNGVLNLGQKAQRSYNTSIGLDYAFDGLGTRLKFVSELYVKFQDRLIPYMLDNVRVKYLAEEQAKGYTYGADLSVGGEFVMDLLSYFRISLMKSNQNIKDDDRGYLKRPTDQTINFSVYFQDRLLNSPTYKVHLNLLYGSRLPLGAPLVRRYSEDFSIPSYKRVDIGFSKDFLDDLVLRRPAFLNKYFNSFAAHVEIFNLLNIQNTISYLWLKDVNNVQYAIPNYLTGRQLNLKLVIKFKNSHR